MAFVPMMSSGRRLVKRSIATSVQDSMKALAGVVFDLDGCLTKQGSIDFMEMRQRAGIPPKADILGHIATLPSEKADQAMKAVLEVEAEGIERMEPRDGLNELFEFLDREGLRRALLTRNTHLALDHFKKLSQKHFHEALDRSFEPPKPSPAALLEICSRWNVDPCDVVMVGDHCDDIECGNRAGATTIQILDFIVPGDEHQAKPIASPNYVVRSLPEMQQVLEELASQKVKSSL